MSFIIGISGQSASGKSTFAALLSELLPNCYYLSIDHHYKSVLPTITSPLDGTVHPDWNHPSAINVPSFLQEYLQVLNKYDYIIIDGAFIFCIDEIQKLLDYKIFTTAAIETRLYRRIKRNLMNKRGSLEEIADYYLKCVRYREAEFSTPSQKHADIIINNENGFDRTPQEIKELIANINK